MKKKYFCRVFNFSFSYIVLLIYLVKWQGNTCKIFSIEVESYFTFWHFGFGVDASDLPVGPLDGGGVVVRVAHHLQVGLEIHQLILRYAASNERKNALILK